MTPEELQAALDAANAELAQLREENGQLLAAKEAAEQQRDAQDLSWQQMQLQRNATMVDRDLKQRLMDRWKLCADDLQAILDGSGTNARKLTDARATVVQARADIATILAGG